MKCIEQLERDYPIDFENHAYEDKCPHVYGYAVRPVDCDIGHHDVSKRMCEDCWNRELGSDNDPIAILKNDRKCDEFEMRFAEAKESLNAFDGIAQNPKILDSGNRRKFDSGAVRDIQEGKGRCDLMPLDVLSTFYNICGVADDIIREDVRLILHDINNFQSDGNVIYLYSTLAFFHGFTDIETMLLEVAKHFEEGAKKYGENNWQKGIPTHCYIDSAVRHYLKYLRGDTDEPHDRAFCWNIICCIWTCIHKPELNDYARVEE